MLDFVIIGAAQAGLSMGYHLTRMKKRFLIVDGGTQIGGSWLNRWDSLRLFTPTEFNHLPGLNFDTPKGHYPNKYEVADYFEKYVSHFELPLKLGVLVESIVKSKDGFILSYGTDTLEAKNVIVATGPFHTPYTPACHQNVSKDVLQIHSNFYKAPSQLDPGDALVVGGGDSGYHILDEISKNIKRQVYFSGDTTVISIPQQFLGKTLWWWFSKIGFLSYSKYSWIGKKLNSTTQPVIGTDVKEILSRENVHPVGRTQDASNDGIVFEKKSVSSIQNIVWATGYRPNFTWIKGLELDRDGYPKNYRGVSTIKGLYFIGLPWMFTRGSATLGGVSKDAQYLADYIQN